MGAKTKSFPVVRQECEGILNISAGEESGGRHTSLFFFFFKYLAFQLVCACVWVVFFFLLKRAVHRLSFIFPVMPLLLWVLDHIPEESKKKGGKEKWKDSEGVFAPLRLKQRLEESDHGTGCHLARSAVFMFSEPVWSNRNGQRCTHTGQEDSMGSFFLASKYGHAYLCYICLLWMSLLPWWWFEVNTASSVHSAVDTVHVCFNISCATVVFFPFLFLSWILVP